MVPVDTEALEYFVNDYVGSLRNKINQIIVCSNEVWFYEKPACHLYQDLWII